MFFSLHVLFDIYIYTYTPCYYVFVNHVLECIVHIILVDVMYVRVSL